MAFSGFASVGHILQGLTGPAEKTARLRNFCKTASRNLGSEVIDSTSCLYKFDLFFDSIQPTVDSFSKVLK